MVGAGDSISLEVSVEVPAGEYVATTLELQVTMVLGTQQVSADGTANMTFTSPSSESSDPEGGGGGALIVVILIVLVAAAAVAVIVLQRGRMSSDEEE